MLDTGIPTVRTTISESCGNFVPPAVCLKGVTKIYHLYTSPREQVIHSIGLDRFMPWRRHRTYQKFHALTEINLTVQPGERLGIVGRNGAGKTTLLKLITGNFRATSGRIDVQGTVQALMQLGLGFHPDFSGYQNIRAALNYNGLTGDAFEEALDDVVEFVELGQFLHQPMKTYSLGMGARVQFAAATAIRPDILIIDEVMGAGDAYFAGKSAHRMEKLTASGCTLLLVSHSTAQVLQFCERAIWLEKGEIKMRDDSIEIVKAYEEFIEQLAWKRKNSTQWAAAASTRKDLPQCRRVAEDYKTVAWQIERLLPLLDTNDPSKGNPRTEKTISRWPGEDGLKIARVEVFDRDGTVNHIIKSGQPLDIEVEIVAEWNDKFKCQFAILIMTLEGLGLTRHLSEPMNFRLKKGETARVRLRYRTTQLAAGDFVFSAALFKHYDPDDVSSAIRYDILSRSFKLKILPTHSSEPAYFHHPSEWIHPPYLPHEK